jgi:hypothetical protein
MGALRASPHVRASLTGASGVLLHIERDRLYSLDRIGAEIWRLFMSGLTPDAIAASISSTHHAPLSLVQGDVLSLLARLEQQGLIVRTESAPDAQPRTTASALTAPALADATVQSAPASAPAPARIVVASRAEVPVAAALVARCVWRLMRVDLELQWRGFSRVYEAVARHRTRAVAYPSEVVTAVCRAMDRASTLYPRHALCLQRSAAATCVLRDHGVAAALVIGARKHPFRAHAWVEVDGAVVNDKRGVKDYYDELDRF